MNEAFINLDLVNKKIYSQIPYEKKGSISFLKYVENNDISRVIGMLEQSRFLIYDFNHVILNKSYNNPKIIPLKS